MGRGRASLLTGYASYHSHSFRQVLENNRKIFCMGRLDDAHIATGNADHTVKIWNVGPGAL